MRTFIPQPAPSVPGELCIRPVARRDVPALVRIYNVSVLRTTATFQIAPDTERARLAWLRAHTGAHPAFVGEVRGELAGWAALSPYCQREAWQHTVEDSIYLDEKFCGRGYGEKMLCHLLGEARRLGHRAVLARIVAGHTASIRLHQKLDFAQVGYLSGVGRKFGRWHDVIYMERDFGAAAAAAAAAATAS
ncbi:MAG: GNAT family N-acetyltransferase [Puniceicoccales bacterium]|jgi:phosphinothricin acetyltransferase|nr:GNAT family N-acetyltransferase [Puniceicoccales bacterium]